MLPHFLPWLSGNLRRPVLVVRCAEHQSAVTIGASAEYSRGCLTSTAGSPARSEARNLYFWQQLGS